MKAFPIANMEGHSNDLGMDLRDYFAAQALQGMTGGSIHPGAIKAIALVAYQVADAMMEARND
jgi:hypothetical protein